MQKAFDLLKASAVGETDKTRRRIILFLTDGDPTDKRELIFKTIRDRNLELNNSVIIFTFGIDTPNPEILTDIAIQNTTKYGYPQNVSVGDITVKTSYLHFRFAKAIRLRKVLSFFVKSQTQCV